MSVTSFVYDLQTAKYTDMPQSSDLPVLQNVYRERLPITGLYTLILLHSGKFRLFLQNVENLLLVIGC